MTRAPQPAAVLWDMDGTLVDTEPFWFAAETALVERFGGTWTEDQARTLVGMGLKDAARVLREHGVDLPPEEMVEVQTDAVVARLRQDVPWRPGALALLRGIREAGVPTALVTMSVRRMAEVVDAAVPFGPFDVVVSGSDVTHAKPHPEPYLLAAERLGVPIEACVAIEDSPPGLASAVASGAAALGVPHMVPLPDGDRWRLWPTLVDRTAEDVAALAADLAAARAR